MRTCSRPTRFVIRAVCALIVFALSFIPVPALGEPGWIIIITVVVSGFTIAEWVGRNRVNDKVYSEEGHGDENEGKHVPLLDKE